jgi:large subunit ribosomal protein L22
LTILHFSRKKKASAFVEKVLRSAIANAQQAAAEVDVDNLFISEIFVNQGSHWKRWQAVPMGRAAQILKRTSHVHVYLEERKGR